MFGSFIRARSPHLATLIFFDVSAKVNREQFVEESDMIIDNGNY